MRYAIFEGNIYSEKLNSHFFRAVDRGECVRIYQLYIFECGILESHIVNRDKCLILSESELQTYKKEHPEMFI